MKVVLQPSQKEDAVYYSDFKGHCFAQLEPDITLKISFNYGSVNDGSEIELHLTDEEIQPVLDLIKSKLSEESKKNLLFFQ
jgi:hypothetical protein